MLIKNAVPSRAPGKTSVRIVRLAALAVMGCSAVLGSVAQASPEAVAEVSRLVEQGKMPQAAKQAESFLKQNPNHVQMRFLQGVIAAEQKQNAQAIKIFSGLTRDYPSLPEPYNNLAVLYAAEGQERKASEVLEQAIRTNPSYATAHENLGDLYARMASDAYSKALSLDNSRQTVQPKLSLITQIFPRSGEAAPVKVATAKLPEAAAAPVPAPVPAPVTPKPVESKPAPASPPAAAPVAPMAPAAKPPEVKPAPVAVAAATVAAAPSAASKPVAVKPVPEVAKTEPPKPEATKQEPVKTAEKPAAEKKAPDAKAVASGEVESAVKAWASAWAGQNLPRYFDAYSDKFTPADGSSLSAWKEQRRQRISGKAAITVSVKDMKVTVDGDTASARFRQYYAAGALKSSTLKTLRLQREGGHWRITREGTGA